MNTITLFYEKNILRKDVSLHATFVKITIFSKRFVEGGFTGKFINDNEKTKIYGDEKSMNLF